MGRNWIGLEHAIAPLIVPVFWKKTKLSIITIGWLSAINNWSVEELKISQQCQTERLMVLNVIPLHTRFAIPKNSGFGYKIPIRPVLFCKKQRMVERVGRWKVYVWWSSSSWKASHWNKQSDIAMFFQNKRFIWLKTLTFLSGETQNIGTKSWALQLDWSTCQNKYYVIILDQNIAHHWSLITEWRESKFR